MESGGSRPQHTYDLRPEDELRFEAGHSSMRIELVDGTAEIRGCELAQGSMSKLYEYSFSNFAGYIHTWEGCRIVVEGTGHCYIVRDTFARSLLNLHSDLQSMRQKAAAIQGEFENPNIGPRVVVVGPPGSGRSTIAMTLLNYAARTTPMTYVDLDVSHNDISLAGMLSAIVIERPVVPTRGWGSSPALAYPFGSPDLSANGKLYQVQLVQLLKSLEARDDAFPDSKHNGWIIKAPTWRSPESYDLVLESVRSVNPHVIITVGYDRLVHDLKEALQERISTGKTQIVNLARSGGVIYQGEVQNQMARQIQIRDYFYGPSRELGPARITLPISEKFVVVKLKLQDTISITAMPIDHQDEPMEAELEVFPITVDRTLRHSLLAVSFAQSIEQVMFSNVAGYLHVLDVDLEKKKFTCTSPLERIEIGAPGPIYLIQTDFKFTDVE